MGFANGFFGENLCLGTGESEEGLGDCSGEGGEGISVVMVESVGDVEAVGDVEGDLLVLLLGTTGGLGDKGG